MISHINVGYGDDVTIKELALIISEIVGFRGDITFDSSKPDGTSRKLMDSGRLKMMGWRPEIDLRSGISDTYTWFKTSNEHRM